MSAKGDIGVIDHGFMHGRGDHPCTFPWPGRATPPCLIVPSTACVGGVQPPRSTGVTERDVDEGSVPGRWGLGASLEEYGMSSTCIPSSTALEANRARSPRATKPASQIFMAAARTRSGPMPAGSPGGENQFDGHARAAQVKGGERLLDVDKRFLANFSEPGIELFLIFLLANVVGNLAALYFSREIAYRDAL